MIIDIFYLSDKTSGLQQFSSRVLQHESRQPMAPVLRCSISAAAAVHDDRGPATVVHDVRGPSAAVHDDHGLAAVVQNDHGLAAVVHDDHGPAAVVQGVHGTVRTAVTVRGATLLLHPPGPALVFLIFDFEFESFELRIASASVS